MSNSKRRKKVRVGFEVEKRIGRWAAKRSVECRAGEEWLVRASERMSENSGSDGLEAWRSMGQSWEIRSF